MLVFTTPLTMKSTCLTVIDSVQRVKDCYPICTDEHKTAVIAFVLQTASPTSETQVSETKDTLWDPLVNLKQSTNKQKTIVRAMLRDESSTFVRT